MTPYQWQKDNLNNALIRLNPIWHGEFDTTATRISTDTRTLQAGDIFLAICGDNFDGHDYIATAYQRGAVLAIVSRAVACDLPQLVVTDTKLALGLLGKYRRDCHPNVQVVALTGSSGKTTTKQMLGAILNNVAPTLVTRGNLNNDLGVPMMLLELCDEHQFAVLELGANHVGEILYTTHLVSPDVACVLNVGTAHLGEFGGRENIAKTKAEIFAGLTNDGTAVLPFGDDYFEQLQAVASGYTAQHLSFGEQKSTYQQAGVPLDELTAYGLNPDDTVLLMGDVFADDVMVLSDKSEFSLHSNLSENELQSADICLNFAGEHNVLNACAAASCALALGLDFEQISDGLKNATPAKGRLNFRRFGEHMFIDDTYNANPNSVMAAANVLEQYGLDDDKVMQKVLVLGDIGELGDGADSEHFALGQQLANVAVDKICAVGVQMTHLVRAVNEIRPNLAVHFDNKADLTNFIQNQIADTPSCVLFKGSRFMAMESVIDGLVGADDGKLDDKD